MIPFWSMYIRTCYCYDFNVINIHIWDPGSILVPYWSLYIWSLFCYDSILINRYENLFFAMISLRLTYTCVCVCVSVRTRACDHVPILIPFWSIYAFHFCYASVFILIFKWTYLIMIPFCPMYIWTCYYYDLAIIIHI